MKEFPKISIIIPTRNEEHFIALCLESILGANYPKDKLEILVIDGMSTDATRDVIAGYIKKHAEIQLLDNPKYITPCALNIGIKKSTADIIIRVDAHAKYDKDYFKNSVENLYKYKADNVGGVITTLPGGSLLFSKSIAEAYASIFGVGTSYFRIGVAEPKEVDTVFGGCYQKATFDKIGLFNENLVRSQDMELNLRLKRAGGKIYLCPDIVSYYYAKASLKDFFVHNFKDGIWAVYPIKFVKLPLSLRHYIPLAFTLGFIALLIASLFSQFFMMLFGIYIGLYLLFAIYFSLMISSKEKDILYIFLMPPTFFARHFGYGLGSIIGIIKLFL